ncbi:MAG TPA: hypothetical protein VH593_07540 [Ktedonobacteraceae bacterium]
MPERIQYFTSYYGGDPRQPYRVDYKGLVSHGCYTRYRGDEATCLLRYRVSDEVRAYERLNEDGIWVDSETIARYVLRGSTDTVDEIDYEEAKRIAAMLGFPELI